MTEHEARTTLERAMAHHRSGDALLVLHGGEEGSTRFANSAITQSVSRTDTRLTVRLAFDGRVGTAQTNVLSDEGVAAAFARAAEIAQQSEPDPEYMPPIDPCPVPRVDACDERFDEATAAARVARVHDAIRVVKESGLTAAGSLTTDAGFTAVMNSRGHFAFHSETSVRMVCTAIGPDSSGWASAGSFRWADVDPVAVAERATAKAIRGANPGAVEPKPTTVILEPAAVAELLAFVAWSLDAKSADEGRSAFAGKLGTQIGVPEVSLLSQPGRPECPVCPFSDEGMPAYDVTWIENGVLKNLAHTRYWAQHTGRSYTGMPTNLIMPGTDMSLDELIANTDDGILVTRFWYIRYVDPMKLLLTGMTRDGLFRIERGAIVGGLKNMRFNESPLRMLERIVGIGQAQPVWGYRPSLVPSLKVEGFTFSSATAF